MYDRATVLHLVNDAQRRTPRCACGAPMIPVDRDGGLWLECTGRSEQPRDLLARLVSLDWLVGHDRRVIIDRSELQAA